MPLATEGRVEETEVTCISAVTKGDVTLPGYSNFFTAVPVRTTTILPYTVPRVDPAVPVKERTTEVVDPS